MNLLTLFSIILIKFLNQIQMKNWIEQGTNIYTNFKTYSYSYYKKVRVILIGSYGVGKSKLFNNLCQGDQKTGISKNSVTENICWKVSNYVYPERGLLTVIDTPGIEKQNQLTSLTLKRSLKNLPSNLVIIMTKLDTRFQISTLPELRNYANIFKKDNQRILFMVSHADILDVNKQQKRNILSSFFQTLKSHNFNQNLILFSNFNSDFERIAKIIYMTGSNKQQKLFDIDDRTFGRYAGFSKADDDQQQILEDIFRNINDLKKMKGSFYRENIIDEALDMLQIPDPKQIQSIRQIIRCFVDSDRSQNMINIPKHEERSLKVENNRMEENKRMLSLNKKENVKIEELKNIKYIYQIKLPKDRKNTDDRSNQQNKLEQYYKKRIEQLENKVNEMVKSHVKQIAQFQCHLERSKKQKQSFRQINISNEHKIQKLQQQIWNLKRQNQDHRKKIRLTQRRYYEINNQLQWQNQQNKRMENKIQILKQEIQNNRALKWRHKELENKYEFIQRRYKELEDRYKQLQRQVKKYQKQKRTDIVHPVKFLSHNQYQYQTIQGHKSIFPTYEDINVRTLRTSYHHSL